MTAATVAREARLTDQWSPELADALERAVEDYDLPASDDWGPLDELSQSTAFDGFDLDPDSTVIVDGTFRTPGTVFVTLNYDSNSDEPISMSDSFPMIVRFKVIDNAVQIEEIEVDTSSFFE